MCLGQTQPRVARGSPREFKGLSADRSSSSAANPPRQKVVSFPRDKTCKGGGNGRQGKKNASVERERGMTKGTGEKRMFWGHWAGRGRLLSKGVGGDLEKKCSSRRGGRGKRGRGHREKRLFFAGGEERGCGGKEGKKTKIRSGGFGGGIKNSLFLRLGTTDGLSNRGRGNDRGSLTVEGKRRRGGGGKKGDDALERSVIFHPVRTREDT